MNKILYYPLHVAHFSGKLCLNGAKMALNSKFKYPVNKTAAKFSWKPDQNVGPQWGPFGSFRLVISNYISYRIFSWISLKILISWPINLKNVHKISCISDCAFCSISVTKIATPPTFFNIFTWNCELFLLNTFKIVISIQNESFQNITFYYMELYDHKYLDMKQ